MREGDLWRRLNANALTRNVFMERIEQKLNTGFPDVLYREKGAGFRCIAGRIELKIAEGKQWVNLNVATEQAVKLRSLCDAGWPCFVLCDHEAHGMALFAVNASKDDTKYAFPSSRLTDKLALHSYENHRVEWDRLFEELLGRN